MNIENQQELYLLVKSAPVGICILDAGSLMAEIVNENYIKATGKPCEDILGHHHWDAFAEARPHYETALAGVIKSGEPYSAEEAQVTLVRNGKEEAVYFSFVYSPLKDAAGIVKRVAIWVMDNTQQVIQRRKVEESEEFSRTVFYNSPVANWSIWGLIWCCTRPMRK